MQYLRQLFVLLLLCPGHISAQVVPQEAIDTIISHYAPDGMKLEKLFRPDFSLFYPSPTSRLGPCYPGKMIFVIVMMARKPEKWLFKVISRGKMIPPAKEISTVEIKGKRYWLDFRTVVFPKDLNDFSDNCLFIQAADATDYKLPVYTIILSETQ